jgi:predicted  nucleic acid-binding Zn ribbon protein
MGFIGAPVQLAAAAEETLVGFQNSLVAQMPLWATLYTHCLLLCEPLGAGGYLPHPLFTPNSRTKKNG